MQQKEEKKMFLKFSGSDKLSDDQFCMSQTGLL